MNYTENTYCDNYLCTKEDCQFLANARNEVPIPDVFYYIDATSCINSDFSQYIKLQGESDDTNGSI